MKQIEMRNLLEDYDAVREFVEALLKKNRIADAVVDETTLIIEALCHNIFDQREDESAVVRVTGQERMGYVSIRIGFEGGMYIPTRQGGGDPTPEDRILSAYADKIDYSYRAGFNRILITVRRGTVNSVLPCVLGMLAALAAFLPIQSLLGREQRLQLLRDLVFPAEELFINAVLMVAAPVTFLSFLKNMTDTYIVAERDSDTRKLQRSIMGSSAISVGLAIAVALLIVWIVREQHFSIAHDASLRLDMPVPEWIASLVPASIFAPFESISPFPLFILAAVVTYAMCSSGVFFDKLKKGIDIGYVLFSRMLSVVMFALPVFVFTAFLDILLRNGFGVLLYLAELLVAVSLSLLVLLLYYALRLRVKKIPIAPFVKKLPPLILENWRVGSAIDAAPFNIRYCARHYGMKRKMLENAIPVLAQINLDGNCFIITLTALIFMLLERTAASVLSVGAVAVLIFFLSLGAPNQPGSFVIAIAIILNYLQSHDLIPLAIVCEMFFGSLLNVTNVLGDIVTVAELEKTLIAREQSGRAAP